MALLKYNDKFYTMNRKRFNKGHEKKERNRARSNKKQASIKFELVKAS